MANPRKRSVPGPVVAVDAKTTRQLQQLAVRRSPLETGGVLWGRRLRGTRWIVTGVTEVPDPGATPRRYRGDPHALLHLLRTTRGRRVVIGMVHTHPRSPARPSPLDGRLAAAGYVHAIVGWEHRRPRVRFFDRPDPDAPMRALPIVDGQPGHRRRRSGDGAP